MHAYIYTRLTLLVYRHKTKTKSKNNKDGVERLSLDVTLSLTSWELRNLKRDGKKYNGRITEGSHCGMITTN